MVSSTSGLIGSPRDVGYTTAKHAVIGLMRAVAQDVGPFGITCNAVCPGWVHTEMADRSAAREAADRGVEPAEIWRERDALQPRGVALAPEEVAETIAFLCSDARDRHQRPGDLGQRGERRLTRCGDGAARARLRCVASRRRRRGARGSPARFAGSYRARLAARRA